jgi:hypothetical protein
VAAETLDEGYNAIRARLIEDVALLYGSFVLLVFDVLRGFACAAACYSGLVCLA